MTAFLNRELENIFQDFTFSINRAVYGQNQVTVVNEQLTCCDLWGCQSQRVCGTIGRTTRTQFNMWPRDAEHILADLDHRGGGTWEGSAHHFIWRRGSVQCHEFYSQEVHLQVSELELQLLKFVELAKKRKERKVTDHHFCYSNPTLIELVAYNYLLFMFAIYNVWVSYCFK